MIFYLIERQKKYQSKGLLWICLSIWNKIIISIDAFLAYLIQHSLYKLWRIKAEIISRYKIDKIDGNSILNIKSKIWEEKELKILIDAFNSPRNKGFWDRSIVTDNMDNQNYADIKQAFVNMDLNSGSLNNLNINPELRIQPLDPITSQKKHYSYNEVQNNSRK